MNYTAHYSLSPPRTMQSASVWTNQWQMGQFLQSKVFNCSLGKAFLPWVRCASGQICSLFYGKQTLDSLSPWDIFFHFQLIICPKYVSNHTQSLSLSLLSLTFQGSLTGLLSNIILGLFSRYLVHCQYNPFNNYFCLKSRNSSQFCVSSIVYSSLLNVLFYSLNTMHFICFSLPQYPLFSFSSPFSFSVNSIMCPPGLPGAHSFP